MKGFPLNLKRIQLIPYNRISDLFDDVYGIRINPATIKKAENECFNNLEHFEEAVMKQLLASHSVNCDETGMRVLGTRWWLHVVSTNRLTLYFPHPKRGSEAMILGDFFLNTMEQ